MFKFAVTFFKNNGFSRESLRRFSPRLFELARCFKYLHWPLSIGDYVRGKAIVDVGCGPGLHSMGFILAGVKSYTGLDPRVNLDSDLIRDPRKARGGNANPCGWTPRQIMSRLPAIRYVRARAQDIDGLPKFDAAVLHNVTEHMMEIEKDIEAISRIVCDGGTLVIRHPNFYAWNGHHMAPRNLDEIDLSDKRQAPFLDWEHLTYRDDWPSLVKDAQNRIRLKDLRVLIERFFTIEIWQEKKSGVFEGGGRLTEAILRKYPDYSAEELETKSVLIVAKRRCASGRRASPVIGGSG